jgi:hypothetical protein
MWLRQCSYLTSTTVLRQLCAGSTGTTILTTTDERVPAASDGHANAVQS